MGAGRMHAATMGTNRVSRKYATGTVYLFLVVILWVSASFVMNALFTDLEYNKPFLLTYICTASFSLYLIKPLFRVYWQGARWADVSGQGKVKSSDDLPSGRPHSRRAASVDTRSSSRTRASLYKPDDSDEPLSVRDTALLAFVFCGIWFVANWAMNSALGLTSVSSTTILSSMSGFFTLALGAVVQVEKFTTGKLAAVVFSILGVVLVTRADRSAAAGDGDARKPSAPLLGDSLALASAVAYAFYVILLKMRIKDERRISMTLFFGFVGIFDIFCLWPLGFLLHATGVETWQMAHGLAVWVSILVNAAITFVSDALYLKAMLLTSPLAVTLGISLTIPLAMVGDLLRGTDIGGWQGGLGGLLVLGSFVANGLIDVHLQKEEAEPETGHDREALLGQNM